MKTFSKTFSNHTLIIKNSNINVFFFKIHKDILHECGYKTGDNFRLCIVFTNILMEHYYYINHLDFKKNKEESAIEGNLNK